MVNRLFSRLREEDLPDHRKSQPYNLWKAQKGIQQGSCETSNYSAMQDPVILEETNVVYGHSCLLLVLGDQSNESELAYVYNLPIMVARLHQHHQHIKTTNKILSNVLSYHLLLFLLLLVNRSEINSAGEILRWLDQMIKCWINRRTGGWKKYQNCVSSFIAVVLAVMIAVVLEKYYSRFTLTVALLALLLIVL